MLVRSEILDVRDKACPIPVLLTKRKLQSMNAGDVLEVISNYPQTTKNIQKFVERSGNDILKVEDVQGVFKIVIRKNNDSEEGKTAPEEYSCSPADESRKSS